MAALLGAELDQAQEIADAAAEGQICAPANDNAPGQVVLSGSMGAIDRAIKIAGERGIRRSVKLPVSAPFHCAIAPAGWWKRRSEGRGHQALRSCPNVTAWKIDVRARW